MIGVYFIDCVARLAVGGGCPLVYTARLIGAGSVPVTPLAITMRVCNLHTTAPPPDLFSKHGVSSRARVCVMPSLQGEWFEGSFRSCWPATHHRAVCLGIGHLVECEDM